MKLELTTRLVRIVTPDTYGSEICNEVAEGCWDEVEQLMIDEAEERLKEYLAETDFKDAKLTMGKFGSPREYNFGTDWIEFDLEFGDSLLDIIKANVNDEFFTFIKKYGSYSGFISFYPVTKTEWFRAVDNQMTWHHRASDRELALSQYIEWQLREHDFDKITNDYLDDVLEKMGQNGWRADEYEEESA